MSVDFEPGDKIRHKGSSNFYTYLGVKGYGMSTQYIFVSEKEPGRLWHFDERGSVNYEKYVPGLVVGKQYRFRYSSTDNVYRVIYEYTNPLTGNRSWMTEVTDAGRDGEVSTLSPWTMSEGHVSRLTMLDDEDEW